MSKRWLSWKSAFLALAVGTTLSLGLGGGCLSAAIQRILVDAQFS